jgi:hypothetical protein
LAQLEHECFSSFYRLYSLPYRVVLSDDPVSRTARNLFREIISLGENLIVTILGLGGSIGSGKSFTQLKVALEYCDLG